MPGRAIALEEAPLFLDLSGKEMGCLRQRLESPMFQPKTALLSCVEAFSGRFDQH
jgi:hypothetical protein